MNYAALWITIVVILFLLMLGVFVSFKNSKNKGVANVLAVVYTCLIGAVPILLVFVYTRDPNQIDWTVVALCIALDLGVMGFAAYRNCVPRKKARAHACDYVWISLSLVLYASIVGYQRAMPNDFVQQAIAAMFAFVIAIVFASYSVKVVARVRRRALAAVWMFFYSLLFTAFAIVAGVNPVYDVLFAVQIVFLLVCAILILECSYYAFACGRVVG